MKKITMMWALLATVLLGVVGCKNTGGELEVKKPTISVAEAVVDAETMTASVEVTPSANTTAWSWKVDTAEAAGEYTLVNGNAAQTIEVAVEYDTEYTFTAFAANTAGASEPVSVTFNGPEAPVVTPGAASIEVSDVEVRAETLKAIVTVTPSEETAKWYYALYEATLAEVEPTYNEVEGNEATTLTLDIEAGKSYIFKAYAENEAGEACDAVAKTFDAPAAEEEVSGNGELVKLELKNITSLSVDADVEKYKECVRYVAGAVFTEAYNENRFITAAKSSLNPNASYPYVQYNSATTSKVWTEMDLVKNGLVTKEGNTGIQIISGMSYTVAVYAEDAEGNYKVYAEQFTAPAAEINGNVDLKMNIDNIGMTDITATFTADTECRIIAGTRLAVNTQDAGFDANNMTDDEIKAFLVANAASVPTMFYGNQTIHFTHDMGIDTDYIVYAIAIKDGKVGNVVYEKFHTKRPELTGSAAFTSATFEEQTDLYALNYTLTTNADAAKVRIFFTTKVDYNNNKATLDFIMISEDAAYMWDEFEVVDGKVVVESEVYTPGDQYAVYGVAFDAEGNPGALTNLVKLWNAEQDFYQTKAEDEVASAVDMTGTGVVTMTVKEGGVTDEVAAAVVTVNTKSDNVAKAWLMSFNEVYEKDILTEVEANLQGWNAEEGTESIIGAVKEITKSFEPAMIQPKRALSIDDLKKKGFGEAYYNQLKPHEREVAITIDDLKEMRTMIDLRKEEMASQVLHTNALTMKYYTDNNQLTETKNIDYYIDNNTALYTPTYKWNETGADILGDLAAMAEDLRINGLPATEVLVGRNVARSFLKNKEILDLLNNRRVEIGKWEPHFIYPEATLLTSLNCYGNDLDIISYLGSYENEAGINVDYIDPDTIIVIAPGCGVTNYGMITQIDYGQSTFTDYVEKEVPLYEVKDQTRSVILKTAPLLQPKNLSPFRVAKVL